MRSRCYAIKSINRGQYYCGNGKWSGFFSDAARWTNLRAASKVCNQIMEPAHVVILRKARRS